jgi:aconitate hydratase
MGMLPFKFMGGQNAESPGLEGDEVFDIEGLSDNPAPKSVLTIKATKIDEPVVLFKATALLNTNVELNSYHNGGILHIC